AFAGGDVLSSLEYLCADRLVEHWYYWPGVAGGAGGGKYNFNTPTPRKKKKSPFLGFTRQKKEAV
ncbi:hypothetical protein NL480_30005, partial [Klebsiella pneumoniae]|nr:hypothetical protein [Klebsiella pneumoniae]